MDLKAQIESLLFTAGHPVAIKKLADILEIPEIDILKSLQDLSEDYEKNNRGFRLVFLENKVQLASAPNSAQIIKKLVKSDFEEDLSQAALETLAIIAYRGPISRVTIENLRGVNCSFILQNLSIRGLIEKKNNPEDCRSYIYKVTFDFLKHIGLSRIEDLPNFTGEEVKIDNT